jgi:adenosylhomocysteine nucleosidase
MKNVHSAGGLKTMKIGIITAISEEFRAVSDSLGAITSTQLGMFRAGRFCSENHEYLLMESGVGFDNAARATEMLVRDIHPDLLITAGFCGGIAPELHAGDVVVAKKIIIANGSGYEEIPVLLSHIGQTFVSRQADQGARVVGGTFVSTSAITAKKRLAGMLPDHFSYPVVEMESGAIAIIAVEQNIPLLAIRAVSDPAAEEIGFSMKEICGPDLRRIRPYKVLLTALRKPRIIPQLVRLSRSSRRASKSLAAALSRLFLQL